MLVLDQVPPSRLGQEESQVKLAEGQREVTVQFLGPELILEKNFLNASLLKGRWSPFCNREQAHHRKKGGRTL